MGAELDIAKDIHALIKCDLLKGARNADAGPPHPEAYTRREEYDAIFGCYKAIRDASISTRSYPASISPM